MQVPNRIGSEQGSDRISELTKEIRTGLGLVTGGGLVRRKAVYLELEWTRGSDRKNNGGQIGSDWSTGRNEDEERLGQKMGSVRCTEPNQGGVSEPNGKMARKEDRTEPTRVMITEPN